MAANLLDKGLPQSVGTLIELIDGLESWGDRPALRLGGEVAAQEWSYSDLHETALRFAAGLVQAGVGPGEYVVLLAPNRPEWVVAALGIIFAGAVLVPVDHQMDDDSLVHVLNDCNPSLVITASHGERRLQRLVSEIVPAYLLDAPAGASKSWRSLLALDPLGPARVGPARTAVMFYTSGTTGPPKGVPLSHQNLAFQVQKLSELGIATPSDRCLLALPLHHVYPFVVGMLISLRYGMCILLPTTLQGPQILEALQHGGATIILGVPRLYDVMLSGIRNRVHGRGRAVGALFNILLEACVFLRRHLRIRAGLWVFRSLHRRLGPHVRMVVSGGAALDRKTAWTLEGLGWSVTTGYGLTETSPLISLVLPEQRRFDGSGRPVPGVEVRIAPKANAHDVGMGEIQVRGPGVFAGYHGLPDKNERAFTKDGWFRTDDLGYFDRDGFLHVAGRGSTLIVAASGENIQPEDVEEAYARHPLLREIGVLRGDKGLAAVVVPAAALIRKQGTNDIDAKVREAVGEIAPTIPSYWRLSDLVISGEALARTRLGKLRRAQLKARYDTLRSGRAAEDRTTPGPMPFDQMSDDDRDLVSVPAANVVWRWLVRRYEDRRLTPDTSPGLDLGIDSLEWMSVTLEIQRLTGGQITEEATGRIETVRDLLIEVVQAAEKGQEAIASGSAASTARLGTWQKRWLVPLGPLGRICAYVLHCMLRFFALTLFRLEVTGREHLRRDGNFVIAPNHTSVLDPFALAAALDYSLLRHTFWAAWPGMAFANPLFRAVSRLAQALPIEADRAAFSSLALAEIVLSDGRNLVWFPEGGRSQTGVLQPFKLGIGVLLTKCDFPVVPVSISGTFDAMPLGRTFPRLRRVCVTFGAAVTPQELERRGQGVSSRERIASALHDVVGALGR